MDFILRMRKLFTASNAVNVAAIRRTGRCHCLTTHLEWV